MGSTTGNTYPLSSLSFLIPCYNDQTTIERVISEATDVGSRIAKIHEIVVISDGSKDRTGMILTKLGKKVQNLRIITHPINQGYGRTIIELYYAGTKEWLFTIPGDYQVGARELEKLIPFSRSADMILGWRVNRHDPPNRLFASWVYNTLLHMLFGIGLHDSNSVRLMRRSILRDIQLSSTSAFVDAELIIRAIESGFRVREVPIGHRSRQDRKPGGGNNWRTIWETVVEMMRFAYEKIH